MFVWPLPPDGQHGIDFTFEYDTDIIRSRRGEEQRNAKRANPRLSIAFTDWRHADQAREMRRYFHNRLQKTSDANMAATEDFLMPIWTEAQVVVSPIVYSTTSGNVFFNDLCRYESLDIVQYFTNGIDSFLAKIEFSTGDGSKYNRCSYFLTALDGQDVSKLKEGWLAIPCLPVRFTESVTRQFTTGDIIESKMTFPVSPGKFTMPVLQPAPARPNHPLDRELFDFPINMRTPVDVSMMDNSVRLDYGRTDPKVFHNINYISEVYKIGMEFYNKPDIEAFVDFYRRHEGMKRSFYWPSNEFDFKIAPGITAWNDYGIKLKGLEAVDIFYHRDARDENGEVIPYDAENPPVLPPNPIVGIAIWYKGEWVTNIVNTVQVRDGCAYLACKYPFPPIDPKRPLTDRTRISILHQARFATDEMTVRYSTPVIAEISTGIQTIPDEGYRRDD